MKDDDGFSFGVLLGLLAGVTFTLLLGALAYWTLGKSVFNEYQTLVAGIVAFVGAVATVWIINKQIRASQQIAEDERTRKNFAARATLPFALATISDYTRNSIKYLTDIRRANRQSPNTVIIHCKPEPNSLPAFPPDTLSVLERCIELADDNPRNLIAQLVATLQIQRSNITLIHDVLCNPRRYDIAIIPTNIDRNIFVSLKAYLLTSRLFEYARRTSDDVVEAVTKDDFRNAAFSNNLRDLEFEEIYKVNDSLGLT